MYHDFKIVIIFTLYHQQAFHVNQVQVYMYIRMVLLCHLSTVAKLLMHIHCCTKLPIDFAGSKILTFFLISSAVIDNNFLAFRPDIIQFR